MDAAGLMARLQAFCSGEIALQLPDTAAPTPWQAPQAALPPLSARLLARSVTDDWRVTSYSGLQQNGHSAAQDLLPRLDVDAAGVGEVAEEPQLTPHQFPAARRRGRFSTVCSKISILPSRFPPTGWRRAQLSGFEESGPRY